MTEEIKFTHPRSLARERAIQFIYQCECERLFHFTDNHFNNFVEYQKIDREVSSYTKTLVKGFFTEREQIDAKLENLSQGWKLSRMAVIDRAILRIAAYEIFIKDVPFKVVINEAIELAKKYGTEQSGSFVNGILDKLAHEEA